LNLPSTALLGAVVAGALGGVHCIAMCTGWLTALAPRGATATILPARALLAMRVAGQAGRVTMYALLGALLGAAGGTAFAATLAPWRQGLYVLANVMLLWLALTLAAGAFNFAWLERVGLKVFARALPIVRRLAPRRDLPSRFLLGMLWGLTPCALIYGVLPLAMLSGSALDGALIMLAFGIGTLPNLLAADWLLKRANLDRRGLRLVAPVVVGAFALAGIYHALVAPASLYAGPFCLSH
jgi:sulfite exporter TauE/SafE